MVKNILIIFLDVSLDWKYPKHINDINNFDENIPIVMILYVITGNNNGFTEIRYSKYLTSKNIITVIINRRGHDKNIDLISNKMVLFGYNNDIYDIVKYISKKYPKNPLLFLGTVYFLLLHCFVVNMIAVFDNLLIRF